MQNFALISNLMSDFVYIAYLVSFWTKYLFTICLFHFIYLPLGPFVPLSLCLLNPYHARAHQSLVPEFTSRCFGLAQNIVKISFRLLLELFRNGLAK